MKNYYEDEKNSREFIEGYMYDEQNGVELIVIFTGSGEKIILKDNALNRLKLNKYIEKMEQQAREGKKFISIINRKFDNKDFNITKILYVFYIFLVLSVMLGLGVLNGIVPINLFLALTLTNIGAVGVLETVRFVLENKTNKKVEDIQKNLYFVNMNDILLESLSKSDKALKGLSRQTAEMIKDFYDAGELNINACNVLTHTDVITLQDNLNMEALDEKIVEVNFSKKGHQRLDTIDDSDKVLSFKPKTNFGGKKK